MRKLSTKALNYTVAVSLTAFSIYAFYRSIFKFGFDGIVFTNELIKKIILIQVMNILVFSIVILVTTKLLMQENISIFKVILGGTYWEFNVMGALLLMEDTPYTAYLVLVSILYLIVFLVKLYKFIKDVKSIKKIDKSTLA